MTITTFHCNPLFFLVGGTLRWKAPELLEGASTLTQATDVYAFAILCIEVLAMGQVPWFLDDDESVRHLVLSKLPLSFHSRRYLINLIVYIRSEQTTGNTC